MCFLIEIWGILVTCTSFINTFLFYNWIHPYFTFDQVTLKKIVFLFYSVLFCPKFSFSVLNTDVLCSFIPGPDTDLISRPFSTFNRPLSKVLTRIREYLPHFDISTKNWSSYRCESWNHDAADFRFSQIINERFYQKWRFSHSNKNISNASSWFWSSRSKWYFNHPW